MFAAFDLNLEGITYEDRYIAAGKHIRDENKKTLSAALSNYIRPDYSIDGGKLQEDWFGAINADVFLSHSHDDIDLALGIAGLLQEELKLNTFVDSVFWGYSIDLLNQINTRYNILKRDKDGTITYGHTGAVHAAGHVDMMLATSLMKMIGRCECMFFINTHNTIIPANPQSETFSPWIYFENVVANQMPRTLPDRHAHLMHFANESTGLPITHPMDLDEFIHMDFNALNDWLKCNETGEAALDALYHKHKLLSGLL